MSRVAVASGLVVAALAGAAVALLVAPLPRSPTPDPVGTSGPGGPGGPAGAGASGASGSDWLRRGRPLWVVLTAAAAYLFVGGAAGAVTAPLLGAATWVVIERSEPASVRRERDAARRDLPHVVGLLGDALRSGQSATEALAVVAAALPGPASSRLVAVVPRLRLGIDPHTVFTELTADPALAPLGRALARAQRTGAPVVATVDRLAAELARTARADVEDRARAVGVRAAVPLGLCLLPSFLLLGIVPVVAGLFAGMGL